MKLAAAPDVVHLRRRLTTKDISAMFDHSYRQHSMRSVCDGLPSLERESGNCRTGHWWTG